MPVPEYSTFVGQLEEFLADHGSEIPLDSSTEKITKKLTGFIRMFATSHQLASITEFTLGSLPYRDAHARLTTRDGRIDVAVTGIDDLPVLIEIDRTDKTWNLEKLMHGLARGHHCIWIRWGDPRMKVTLPIPEGIDLICVVVPAAKGWDPDRNATHAGRRTLPLLHEIAGPVTTRFVDPGTLMSLEERKLRDERVANRKQEQKARKQRRKAEGRTRGTSVNPRSRNSADRGRGYELATNPSLDGEARARLADDIDKERARLDKQVDKERKLRAKSPTGRIQEQPNDPPADIAEGD
jgi:hypothetical protein